MKNWIILDSENWLKMLIFNYLLAYDILLVWLEPILEATWNFPFILGSLFVFFDLFMDVDISLEAFVGKTDLTRCAWKKAVYKQFFPGTLWSLRWLSITLIILRVTSSPLVENWKICMTGKCQFEVTSTAHYKWFTGKGCAPVERNVLPQELQKNDSKERNINNII